MIKAILIVVAVAIAGLLAFAANKPDSFRVERSATIKAPAAKVYAILEDFDQSLAWSPYEKKDPSMKRSRSGPAKGKGATYAFDGNKEVGTGRLEVIDTVPPDKLVIRLTMEKPFEARNTIEYTLAPDGDGTRMTWAIHGPMPFVSKVMTVFFDMDKMIGKDFEEGLASLKTYAEKQA